MIRVLIGANSSILHQGLKAMMTHEPRIQVIGQVAELKTLEQACHTQQPDVVLLEFAMLEAADLAVLSALQDDVAIALLVSRSQSYSVTALLQAGVRAILPMDVTTPELLLTVEAIATGFVMLHPDASDILLEELPTANELEGPTDILTVTLTPRENEVLQLLARGLANKAIARQLDISEHTVKFHISSIFSKFNVSSRTEAVTVAMQQGLVFI